jgi:hypothetical protein
MVSSSIAAFKKIKAIPVRAMETHRVLRHQELHMKGSQLTGGIEVSLMYQLRSTPPGRFLIFISARGCQPQDHRQQSSEDENICRPV